MNGEINIYKLVVYNEMVYLQIGCLVIFIRIWIIISKVFKIPTVGNLYCVEKRYDLFR